MDILTGAGEIITASPTNNPDLYHGFCNSYGSLGYAVRLRIELEPVLPYVGLRHVQFDSWTSCARPSRRSPNHVIGWASRSTFSTA